MTILFFLLVVALTFVGAKPSQDAAVHSSLRKLRSIGTGEFVYNKCSGRSDFSTGFVLDAGYALCQGDVQFGIFSFDQGGGKTLYSLQVRENGKFVKSFGSPVTVEDENPDDVFLAMTLQHDANLILFNRQGISGCVVLPGRDSSDNHLTLRVSGEEIVLEIADKEDDVVWRHLVRASISNDSKEEEEAFGCYPDLEPLCYSSWTPGQRVSWKEFLCVYDSNGNIKYKYGLDETGSLGLYYYDDLVYRPADDPEWIRGDYLHFQDDGHLTLYKIMPARLGFRGNKKYIWTSECIDSIAIKMVMTSDGDVQKLTKTSLVWSLMGSEHPEPPVADARESVREVCNADPI